MVTHTHITTAKVLKPLKASVLYLGHVRELRKYLGFLGSIFIPMFLVAQNYLHTSIHLCWYLQTSPVTLVGLVEKNGEHHCVGESQCGISGVLVSSPNGSDTTDRS
jgi:hypothetical protein